MITLSGAELLKIANEELRKQPWARRGMKLTQVEQKGSTLVFFGDGLTEGEVVTHIDLLKNLDDLADNLSQRYRLAE